MKNSLVNKFSMYITASLVLWLSSCAKEPVWDELEQHWRLEEFTVLSTQETIYCENLFYGITSMVTELAEKQITNGMEDVNSSKGYGIYIARTVYNKKDNKLILTDFKARFETSDSKVDATAEQLKPFGIVNPKETVFKIVELSHKKLVLESDYARLKLKKF